MRKFKVNKSYKLSGKPAYFLGYVDGINIFKLEKMETLYCFYYSSKPIKDELTEINRDKIDFLNSEQLPTEIEEHNFADLKLDTKVFLKFIYTIKPLIPNTAFCEQGMLEKLFDKKGLIIDETKKIDLKDKYRAVYPDYCLIKGDSLYRQTDLREKYPDLILEITEFDKQAFLDKAVFNDRQKIYLTAKSVESYGGAHKEFDDWQKKATSDFSDYFKDALMAKFKRVFTVKSEQSDYFKKIGVELDKIIILKPSI